MLMHTLHTQHDRRFPMLPAPARGLADTTPQAPPPAPQAPPPSASDLSTRDELDVRTGKAFQIVGGVVGGAGAILLMTIAGKPGASSAIKKGFIIATGGIALLGAWLALSPALRAQVTSAIISASKRSN